jgi:hypothetical protein
MSGRTVEQLTLALPVSQSGAGLNLFPNSALSSTAEARRQLPIHPFTVSTIHHPKNITGILDQQGKNGGTQSSDVRKIKPIHAPTKIAPLYPHSFENDLLLSQQLLRFRLASTVEKTSIEAMKTELRIVFAMGVMVGGDECGQLLSRLGL